MPRPSRTFIFLLLFLCGAFSILNSQIEGGYWVSSHSAGPGVVCSDEQLDSKATCATHVFCTSPPNPIVSFDIIAFAAQTCSNQPVANFAQTSGAIGGMQESAYAKATAFFYKS